MKQVNSTSHLRTQLQKFRLHFEPLSHDRKPYLTPQHISAVALLLHIIKTCYRKLANLVRTLHRPSPKFSRKSLSRTVAYFKSFQIRWYHLVIAILVTILLSPHARATATPPVKVAHKPIKLLSTLQQPELKPEAKADPIPVPEPVAPPAPVYVAPVVVQGGCGSDPYMAQIYQHESGCRVDAINASSGAYGLCQSLPGYKMATTGADWATSWATQNAWCIGYANARYGSPAAAWSFWLQNRWW